MADVIFKKNYPNGKVTYDKQTGNAIFTPNQVTSDTPVYIYYTGAIGNANYYPGYLAAPEAIAKRYFEDPNFNGVVVINNYENDSVYTDNYVQNSVKDNKRIVDNLEKQYGVELDKRNVIGSSIGDRFALFDFVSEVRNGTDSGFCVVTGASKINVKQGFNYNNQINGGTNDPNRAFLSEDDYNALKGKTVFTFESTSGHNYTYVNALADHDVNVFLVECSDGGHNNLSLKPLQDNVFAFLAGDEDAIDNFIRNGNYHFKKCVDAKNNKWVEASTEEVKAALISSVLSSDYTLKNNLGSLGTKADKLRNSLGSSLANSIVKSDDDYVASAVNNILTAINNSNILNSFGSISCESTTKVPPSEIDMLYDYADSMYNLFDKLATECQAAKAISEHLDDTDWLLQHEAEMAFNMKDEPVDTGSQNTDNYNGGGSNSNGSSKKGTSNNNGATNNGETLVNDTSSTKKQTDKKDTSSSTEEEPVNNKQSLNNTVTDEDNVKEVEPVNNTVSNTAPAAPETQPNVSSQPVNNVIASEPISQNEVVPEPVETDDIIDALDELASENDNLILDDYNDTSTDSSNDSLTPVLEDNPGNEEIIPEETVAENTATEVESTNNTARNIGLAIGVAAAGVAGYGVYKGVKKMQENSDGEELQEDDEEFSDE